MRRTWRAALQGVIAGSHRSFSACEGRVALYFFTVEAGLTRVHFANRERQNRGNKYDMHFSSHVAEACAVTSCLHDVLCRQYRSSTYCSPAVP